MHRVEEELQGNGGISKFSWIQTLSSVADQSNTMLDLLHRRGICSI